MNCCLIATKIIQVYLRVVRKKMASKMSQPVRLEAVCASNSRQNGGHSCRKMSLWLEPFFPQNEPKIRTIQKGAEIFSSNWRSFVTFHKRSLDFFVKLEVVSDVTQNLVLYWQKFLKMYFYKKRIKHSANWFHEIYFKKHFAMTSFLNTDVNRIDQGLPTMVLTTKRSTLDLIWL